MLWNGKILDTTTDRQFIISPAGYAEYQVIALDNAGTESFASEPVAANHDKYTKLYEAEATAEKAFYPYKGYSGKGFIELSKQKNTAVSFQIIVPEAGTYAISFRYANGNGPINTSNKAAIRSLKNGDDFLGTIVFPQRGIDEWSDWGFTNTVEVSLKKGTHALQLSFEPANENMNFEVNQAMIDLMQVTQIK